MVVTRVTMGMRVIKMVRVVLLVTMVLLLVRMVWIRERREEERLRVYLGSKYAPPYIMPLGPELTYTPILTTRP
jgi:uncharacterized membrane protein YadS